MIGVRESSVFGGVTPRSGVTRKGGQRFNHMIGARELPVFRETGFVSAKYEFSAYGRVLRVLGLAEA
ncbi:hypothetical protein BMS3Bbin12_00269 [bacterium BMS3Bbin12]|nr:hypothetical protein BMS3Bbin12_00269 [bacterium BMS3Bbin12]GBE51370.1 hypothetical protein BMS3Bbin13_02328 [bacterium BMS3Bbin13]